MKTRITRRYFLGTSIAAGAATLAAPMVARGQTATVKLGLIHPVTGAVAAAGQSHAGN